MKFNQRQFVQVLGAAAPGIQLERRWQPQIPAWHKKPGRPVLDIAAPWKLKSDVEANGPELRRM